MARKTMMAATRLAAAALATLALVSVSPAPAGADWVAGGWGDRGSGSRHGWQSGHATGRSRIHVPDPRARVIVTSPGAKVIVVPRPYVYAPSYVAPTPTLRWVPGYWTYQWVPQVSTVYVYVPGYYTAEGHWVESHYAPRLSQTGSYQAVWVGGYWSP